MLNSHAQDDRSANADSVIMIETPPVENEEAGNDEDEEADILSDTTVYITSIKIYPDTVAAWKNNKRFAYMKDIDSLLKIKQQEELDALNKRLKSRPNTFFQKLFSSGILQLLFWAVAIAFVLLILYKLFLSNGIFKRNVARSPVNEVPEEEKIATVADYDKLIHQSIKLGDYRMAVRYLFLKTLVQLADKELLHYAADKTNYQYVQEIGAGKKNEFASLVLNYEYVWYGNFALNAELFTAIEKIFTSFNSKIQ
jgi:hypothetical protein